MRSLKRVCLLVLLAGLASFLTLHYPMHLRHALLKKYGPASSSLDCPACRHAPPQRDDRPHEAKNSASENLADNEAESIQDDIPDLVPQPEHSDTGNDVKDPVDINVEELQDSETGIRESEDSGEQGESVVVGESVDTVANGDVSNSNNMKPSDSGGGGSGAAQNRLIILAYMRSGSSMTGSLFNSHPDVFYWYEPLHSMGARHGKRNSHIDKWVKRQQFSSSDEAAAQVSALLSCDIQNVYWEALTDGFMNNGRATRPFKSCFRMGSRDMVLRHSRTVWNACLGNLTSTCRKDYRVIAMKTIRFRMSRAVELMKRDPGLRVLHLVRDPRGILESRHRLGFANFSDLHAEAQNLCNVMADDLAVSQNMDKELKQRYMLARYEDVARSPLLASKLLHHFVGLELSEEGMMLVKKVSEKAPGKRKMCPTCEARESNSTARSQEWRQVMAPINVQVISTHCSDLMTQLGYHVHFRNHAELMDPSFSSVERPRLDVDTSSIGDVNEKDIK